MGGSNNKKAGPPLCARGCGYYGVPEHHDLCSNCYEDFLKEQIAKSFVQSDATVAEPTNVDDKIASLVSDLVAFVENHFGGLSISSSSSSSSSDTMSSSSLSLGASTTAVQKKSRCKTCNKRVGLLGFKCRCENLFCGTHRYPEKHECEVDYKAAGREKLAKENPLCGGDKMNLRI